MTKVNELMIMQMRNKYWHRLIPIDTIAKEHGLHKDTVKNYVNGKYLTDKMPLNEQIPYWVLAKVAVKNRHSFWLPSGKHTYTDLKWEFERGNTAWLYDQIKTIKQL